MASGWTTTSALADSLDDIRSSARITREMEGVVSQLVTKETLGEGIGLSWQELTYAKLTAQAVTENTELDNPQKISDTIMAITPTMVAVETFLTDRVQARINKKGFAKIGVLAQNAVERKKDEDGILLFATFTGTSDPGAGVTLASGFIASAAANIRGNTTEPGKDPIHCVLHPFQIHDLYNELVANVGTGILTEGPTSRVLQGGFDLPVANVKIYPDGNITIDGSDDALGAVFAKEGVILVQGRAPIIKTVRNEKRGGGGEHIYHYDEYAYGERQAVWNYSMQSDATAPTS